MLGAAAFASAPNVLSFPAVALPAMGLLLLAGLHIYIGARLVPVLPMAAGLMAATALLGLWALLVSTTATAFGRRSAPAWLTWAGLIAVGFFSSLLVLTVLRDALLLAAAAARAGGWQAPEGLAGITALAVPALAAAASLLGFVNARRRPAVRHVDVPIAGLPAALDGFSIVQISDLHVGPTIRRGFVQRVVDAANALAPDLTVVSGDVVDGRVADLHAHTQPLGQLQARHGVFAVTGNHEYYSGAAEWIAEFQRLGIVILMNEHVLIEHNGARFVLAGVADHSAHHFDPAHRSDPRQALHGAPADARPKRCCWRTSRAVRRPPPRPALTCSCPVTPMAASSCPGTCSCRCSSPTRPGCTATARCGSTSAAAPATGARPSAWVRRRRSRGCDSCSLGPQATASGGRLAGRAGACKPRPFVRRGPVRRDCSSSALSPPRGRRKLGAARRFRAAAPQ